MSSMSRQERAATAPSNRVSSENRDTTPYANHILLVCLIAVGLTLLSAFLPWYTWSWNSFVDGPPILDSINRMEDPECFIGRSILSAKPGANNCRLEMNAFRHQGPSLVPPIVAFVGLIAGILEWLYRKRPVWRKRYARVVFALALANLGALYAAYVLVLPAWAPSEATMCNAPDSSICFAYGYGLWFAIVGGTAWSGASATWLLADRRAGRSGADSKVTTP